MMPKRFAAIVALLVLGGCSTSSGDGTSKVTPQDAARVQVVDTVPENVARFSNLSATVCREGGLVDPGREKAMLLLKMRAFQNGYLLMHSVTVGPVSGSLAASCPGGVQARGVGFQLAKPKK